MRHFDLNAHLHAAFATVVAWLLCCVAASAEEPLPVREVGPGLFVYTAPYQLAAPINRGAVGNLGFVVGRDAIAVIDTGGSLTAGRQLLAAIRARSDLPIRWVINTHFHPDHVLGNAAFEGPGTRFIGHANLRLALASRAAVYLESNARLVGEAGFAGTRVVLPDEAVQGVREIDLGDRVLVLEAHGTAHTNTDLTVLDRKTGLWWLSDLLFVRHVPALDGSLNGWLRFIAEAKSRTVAGVIPGHGPAPLDWPQAVAPQEAYLARLRKEIRVMIEAGRPISEAARRAGVSEADAWALFDDFDARNATAAFKELEWE